MQRRDFIAFLGGVAAMGPIATQAQQPTPGKWRIGMLAPEIRQKPIREGLRELGYVEGQNLLIEWRFDDRVDRLPALATELVGLKPNVIAATGTQAAQAAQQATKSIPIVMVASNPIPPRRTRALNPSRFCNIIKTVCCAPATGFPAQIA